MAMQHCSTALSLQLGSLQSLGSQQTGASLSCAPTAYGGVKPAPTRIVALASTSGSQAGPNVVTLSRRDAALAGVVGLLAVAMPALADDVDEQYKRETQEVIDQVRSTLALEKTDPSKPGAVQSLKKASNTWVAKYRREKNVAGKPSFSNMYSVLNAISGHYISFGPTYPIPAKRKERILEEVQTAEKALGRGR